MTYLSQELAKFFQRNSRRYIFRNGMSLNELAWEMSAQLGFSQVDPSVLSKVINGKRLFSPEQLEIFCRVVKATAAEKKQLINALQKDLLSRQGFKNFPYLVKEDKDSVPFSK